ncbi:MAG: hypothetical protein Q7J73_09445 [Dehalococcoidales bacterium]|nr:hypothetical protein [Dehalococcoidales bacterium]
MARFKLDIAPLRPTASAFQNRAAAAEFIETNFPPTASLEPRVRLINCEGNFPEVGALVEMVQGIRSGARGNQALGFISSDAHVIDAVTALAEKHQVPLFISNAVDNAFEDLQPVGILTQADEDTFQWLCHLGGAVTSAEIARAKGIEPAAATNRLINVVKKGYVFRISRSRREGDLFVAPCLRSETQPEAVPADFQVTGGEPDIQLPSEIRDSVLQLAREQGKKPEQVLGEAWKAYFRQNSEALQQEVTKVRELIRSGDTDALVNFTTPDLDEQAKEAELRARGNKGGA